MRIHDRQRKRSPYVSRKTFDVAIVVQLLVDLFCALTSQPPKTRADGVAKIGFDSAD
jgi:hypothetical protein